MISIENPSDTCADLLNYRRLPARLTSEQVATILGFKPHDIAPLIRAKLLMPLGGGPRNSVKYFHAAEIECRARDRRWLDRATRTISRRVTNSPTTPPSTM